MKGKAQNSWFLNTRSNFESTGLGERRQGSQTGIHHLYGGLAQRSFEPEARCSIRDLQLPTFVAPEGVAAWLFTPSLREHVAALSTVMPRFDASGSKRATATIPGSV